MADKVSQNLSGDPNSKKWMAIHGGIYDVGKFMVEHPGGEEVLVELLQTDASKQWDEISHTQQAAQIRDKLKIGDVGDPRFELKDEGGTGPGDDDDDDWGYVEPKEESSPYFYPFVALGVLLYAYLMYYMFM